MENENKPVERSLEDREAELKRREELITREEQVLAREKLAGSSANVPQPTPVIETDHEYRLRIEREAGMR